jgi:pilus assembly protein CpaE
MENIKILIVNHNITATDNLTKLLQFENDFEVIGQVHTGEEGVRSYEALAPDVVLMDHGLPEMNGFQATDVILEIDPSAQVILMYIEPGTGQARRAIKCGATDFLTSPISPDMLVSSIREAAEKRVPILPPVIEPMPDRRPLGKIISIYSGKGGVGCTLIASNLALALQSEETPCVLVDADLQYGDVPISFNLQAHFTIADIAIQSVGLDEELIQEILLSHESGLRVLAAPPRPEMADSIQAGAFSQILSTLKRLFAYTVVDTASYLNDITLAALEASDQIVTVLTPDIPPIKNTRLFLDTLMELGIPKEKVLLILNKVKKGDHIRSDQVAQNLRYDVVVEIPFDRVAVRNSINRGEPLLTDQRTHPLTKPMLDLARTVRERLVVTVEE